MQISPAKKEKLKASFADLHPRYPAGHPQGGKFMPKGGADYVNAVAKNTGKSPAEVKKALGSSGSVNPKAELKGKQDYKNALPSEVVKEIQSNTQSFGEALEARHLAEQAKLNAVKGTKREAGKAFTAAKKEVSVKQKAIEAVLIKHGASKEKAKQIAEKLIAQKMEKLKGDVKPIEKPVEKPIEKEVKAKPKAVPVKQAEQTAPVAKPIAVPEPEKKTEAIAPKVEPTNATQSPQTEQKLVAKEIPIKQFNKELDAWKKHIDKIPKNEKASISNIEDNKKIIQAISLEYGGYKAVKSKYVEDHDHIAVTDSKGRLQSALHYQHSKEDGFNVEHLVTAPWNLQKDHPNKQKGSGAKAIAEAVKKSKELGYGGKISLYALPDAMPFYKHLGFKQGKDEKFTLTPEAANELLKKYGS